MDADTGRDGGAVDRYWRRRAAVLAVVLGVLVLLVYGCGGDDEDTAGDSGDEAAIPGVTPTVTVTATHRVRATPVRRVPCAEKDLVVGLIADQDVYVGAQRPRFTATVVNTGAEPCTFDGDIDVRVTSGADRVWSSAQCVRGGSSGRTLRRGIPHVTTVTWDRRRAPDDCRARGVPARPGTYVATVRAGDLKPARGVFHLR